MFGTVVRRERNAGQRTFDVRGLRLIVQQSPKPSMHAHDERDDTCYEAHGSQTVWG
jgi:hypothetical protein